MKVAVAGGGISGLATAYALQSLQPDLHIEIFEAAGRCGGKAWTDNTPEGYRCEWGVNGFLDNKPKTLELCRDLNLHTLRASDSAKRRYVYRHDRLNRLPESPTEFLTSRLLSMSGRMRVVAEALIPKGDSSNETLKEFAVRRLGAEGFEALIDPMASGVFAGDPATMSLASCFPRIHELETQYGSLIRALISLQLRARREGKHDLPGAGPGGTLTSFPLGMSELIDRLEESFSGQISKHSPLLGISPIGTRYQLQIKGRGLETFDVVILAVPAPAQAELLEGICSPASRTLDNIEYPPLSVVCLGYQLKDIPQQVDGFGFLVPFAEKRRILGAVIDSNVFTQRAPAGRGLLRIMVGGSRAPHLAMLDDNKLMDLARSELSIMTGLSAEPEFCRIYRHQQAIPQYALGHSRKIEYAEQQIEAFPGLYLSGNALRGVSLNDCVLNAYRIAGNVARDFPLTHAN